MLLLFPDLGEPQNSITIGLRGIEPCFNSNTSFANASIFFIFSRISFSLFILELSMLNFYRKIPAF